MDEVVWIRTDWTAWSDVKARESEKWGWAGGGVSPVGCLIECFCCYR